MLAVAISGPACHRLDNAEDNGELRYGEEITKYFLEYLRSNIIWDGGSDRDIQVRIGKARTALTSVIHQHAWRPELSSICTKQTNIYIHPNT